MTVTPPADDGRSMYARMLAGELYLADDPEITAASQRAMRLQQAYNTFPSDDLAGRSAILRELLGAVGEDTVIRPPLYVDYGSNLFVGARVFVNCGLVALDVATIHIGDDAQIGPNVQLLTPTHPLDAELRRAKWEAGEPIVIGANVWIGGGAIVLPGVTVGADTVVGAGAVVTRDLPDGVLAVGNPAKVVRRL